MTEVHLGLDVGGTASRWVACDADGVVRGRGSVGGATAHVFNPAERVRLTAAFDAVGSALTDNGLRAVTLCAGMTGFGAAAASDVQSIAASALGLSPAAVTAVDDIVLAYAAHFQPGEGHLISAGTGSIGIHVTRGGEVVRVGGRGILIDDGGSGSWIALQALDHIFRSLDRNGSFDAVEMLASELFTLIGDNSWSAVRQFVYGGDRGRIGTLAMAVAKAANAGDAVSLDILKRAGQELSVLGDALVKRAGPHPLALVGGVLQLHPVILNSVADCLPAIAISCPAIDSPLAAARLQTHSSAWTALFARGLAMP